MAQAACRIKACCWLEVLLLYPSFIRKYKEQLRCKSRVDLHFEHMEDSQLNTLPVSTMVPGSTWVGVGEKEARRMVSSGDCIPMRYQQFFSGFSIVGFFFPHKGVATDIELFPCGIAKYMHI